MSPATVSWREHGQAHACYQGQTGTGLGMVPTTESRQDMASHGHDTVPVTGLGRNKNRPGHGTNHGVS
jgi:hypothetical protein